MPNTTETVFVEFVVQDEQVESTNEMLVRTGAIDKQLADQFKKTNAELTRRQQVIDNLNKELRASQSQNAKTIADVDAKLQQFTRDFAEGMQEGVIENLKQAGFKFDEFGNIIKKNTDQVKKSGKDILSPFQTLSKQLNETKDRVLNIRTAMERLRRTGGVDTEQFTKLGEALIQREAELKRLQDQFDTVTQSTKKNKEVTEENADVQQALKARLLEITKQLQLLKAAGEDNTEQYRELIKEAGSLKDAVGDVNQEIQNAAANSQSLEGLIGAAQGITASFAVAQGAAGLFGVKSEELEETLLSVNSAMALLQGTQQLVALAQEESATITFLQTAGQKIYNLVIGESIGLLAAFRVALAATGIGLLIIGLIALVQALQKTNRETENANRLLERNKNIIEADTAAIQRNTDEQIARAEAISSKESDIIRLRGRGLQLQKASIEEANSLLGTQRDALDKTSEAYFLLNSQIDKNNELINDIDNKTILEKINLDKQLRSEQLQGIADGLEAQLAGAKKNSKNELNLAIQTARARAAVDLNEAGNNLEKRLLIEAQLQKDIRALNLAFAQVRQQDRIAAVERELIAAQAKSKEINERESQEEIDIKKRGIAEAARLELLQEGLTANARKLIIEKSLADQKQLQKEFNQQSSTDTLNDLISRNNAQLTNIKLTDREKLSIQEENLIAQAQIEVDANRGLVDKIKEIRSKLNEDLRALRLAALQKQLDDELSLEASRTGALRRASERMVGDERKTLNVRIGAINQLASLDIASVNSRQDALDESLKKKFISQQDYNVKYAALVDEETKIVEEAELKKRALIKETTAAAIEFGADTAQQLLSIIQQFGQQQTDAELIRIEEQRTRIDELREAGAITEKEAIARQKKLDQEERSIKRKQAERDKAIAIFQAIINTAAAVARALATGGPVLAAIVGALGAAQIALIASKPIPKFAKGKKDSYQGPGEIGEAGAELLESNGRMYLAKKKTFVWLGSHDKVFNPKETAAMLEKNNMQPYIVKDADPNKYKSVYNNQIDLHKLGKVIADNIPKTGLNIDENGFTEYMHYKNGFTKYLNNRRSY